MNPIPTTTKAKGRSHLRVKTLLVLMVSVAAILSAYRTYLDLNGAGNHARTLRSGSDYESRIESAAALGRSSPQEAETTLSALRFGMVDTDPRIRIASIRAIRAFFLSLQLVSSSPLSDMGHESTALALLEAAGDRDINVRRSAFLALANMPQPRSWADGPPREFLVTLLDGARSPDPAIREGAVMALGSPAWKVDEFRTALLRATRDPLPFIRIAAYRGIAARDFPADPELFLAFIGMLDDADAMVRSDHSLIWKMSTHNLKAKPPKEALPILLKALDRPESGPFALGLVYLLGPDASPAVPTLIARFDASYPGSGIPNAFAAIGPAARPAVPTLIARWKKSLLRNEDPYPGLIRDEIAQALGLLAPGSPEVRALASEQAERIRRMDRANHSTRAEIRLLGFLGRDLPIAREFATECLKAEGASTGRDLNAWISALESFLWDDRVFLEFERIARDSPDQYTRSRCRASIAEEELIRISRRMAE